MRRLFLLLFLAPALLFASRDLCKGPLNAHHMSLLLRGSIDFTYYTDRGEIWMTNPAVVSGGKAPQFDNQFDIPWSIGVELGWNATHCLQFFLQYTHSHAEGKRRSFMDTLDEFYSDYNTHAGYIGARGYLRGWYFPCFGHVAPYAGFKWGFLVQEGVPYTLQSPGAILAQTDYWRSESAVSGSILFGFEWFFSPCLSFLLQGEFLASCGPTPNRNVVVEGGPFTNLNLGGVGWITSWPVSLALRYTF